MTFIQPETEFPVLKKPITHTQTHAHIHIFTDPIFVKRQMSMKPVNINIRQHTYTCKSQEPRHNKHNNTHYTKRDNATQ